MLTMAACAIAGLGASTVIPLVVKSVIDGPIAHHHRSGILALALLALLLGAIESASMWLRRLVLARAALGMETDMRNDLYAQLQRLPVAFHDQWQSGQLLSRATTDISTIRRFVGFGLVFLVVNVLTYVAVVALLIRLYWPLAIIVAVALIPILELSRRFERGFMEISRRLQDQNGDLTTIVEEAATGIRITKAFGRSRLIGGRFADQARLLHGTGMERVTMLGRFWAAIEAIPNAMLAAVLLGGALAVGRGALTLGGLVAFVSLVLSLAWPVDALGWIIGTAEEAETAAARIFEVFDTEPAIVDRPDAVSLLHCQGHLRFDDVVFAYPGTERVVLEGVNLRLEPGETVAVVGATGSGKTSLAMLVPRLYDVTSGHVSLDGQDVRDLTLDSLRRHVGVAFEEPILFSASVRENLLLGWPDASDEDLAVAIDTAQASFVHELPWGLDTRVGEQGLTLSGGQRQRLALARAIVGRPRVLILDDPLSSLDVHTEALVEEALARVLADATALLVVHRPSTVALADRVAFLHDGRIVAVGTHTELMGSVPAYRAILSQEAEPAARAEA